MATWIAAPLVPAYCLHAPLFRARVNAETDHGRAWYRTSLPALPWR